MAYLLAPNNGVINTQLTDLAADAVGGNWTPHPDFTGTLRIGDAADRCFSNTLDTHEALYVSSALEAADFDAQFQVARWGAAAVDNFIGFCYRVQVNAKSFYRVRYNGTDWLLEKVIAGVATTLGTVATPDLLVSLGAAVVVDVHVEGNQHFVWITNATGSVSRTTIQAFDSSLASGRFGIWGSGGGATTGSAPTHVPTNGEYLSYSQVNLRAAKNILSIATPTLGISISALVFAAPFPMSGGALAGGAAPVAFVSIATTGGGALAGGTAPSSSVVVSIYNASVDNLPSGGALVGGAALVQEHIPYAPVGGAVAGGSALILEAIKFAPTGGATCGGTAPSSAVYVVPVAGGALVSGATPVNSVFSIAPIGGALASGAAVITDRQSFHLPSGGALAGGTALAYSIPAGFTPTTENPFGDAFPGWALNYETYAPSRYLGMPANSFAQVGGVTFVANAGGIYSVDAKTDAGQPIRSSFLLPDSDYGSAHNKRIPSVWLGLKSATAMVLKIVTDNANVRYTSVVPGNGTMRTLRVKPGKGIEGRYVKVGLANTNGGDYELESMEIPFTELKRRGR